MKSLKMLFTLVFILLLMQLEAQPIERGEKLNVALFVPNGAELLDFAGPGEVFSNAGFNTYVIGFTEEPFISQGFMKVVPNYSYKNCPKPDIIMIPGGGGNNFYQNPEVITWVKEECKDAILLTVCTGAVVAARGGMLDGLKVTTHYSGYENLEKYCKNCEVLRDARYVDNDRIITTSGISAGIDGSLHLVARIKGMKAAKDVAYYMMYDKWDTKAGLVNIESDFIKYARANGLEAAKTKYNDLLKTNKKPFAGELSNLAREFADKKDYKTANHIMEFCLELYPYEQEMYEEMAELYKIQGKYAPPMQEEFVDILLAGKIDEGIAIFDKVKKTYPNWMLFKESAINWVGYNLVNRKDYDNAIKVLEMNVKAYPDSFNVYDSLGEAYYNAGKIDKAKWNLKKSLELNPDNKHAEELLTKIAENK
ncbi:MAG: DJ-1/PfpI family protein [Saprospiraceae bacterium]|nr:DJ-1/PfpI family protein [Saprospiraceae bacterium]